MLEDKDELSLGMHLFCWSFISFNCNLSCFVARIQVEPTFDLRNLFLFCQILLIPSLLCAILAFYFIFHFIFGSRRFLLELLPQLVLPYFLDVKKWVFFFSSPCSLMLPLYVVVLFSRKTTLSDECSFIWFFIFASWKETKGKKKGSTTDTRIQGALSEEILFGQNGWKRREQEENEDGQRMKRLKVGVHNLLKVSWQPWIKSKSEWLCPKESERRARKHP